MHSRLPQRRVRRRATCRLEWAAAVRVQRLLSGTQLLRHATTAVACTRTGHGPVLGAINTSLLVKRKRPNAKSSRQRVRYSVVRLRGACTKLGGHTGVVYIPFTYATHPRHPRTPDQARTNRKTAHKLTSATTLDEVAISGVSRLAHTPWAGHTVRMAVLRRRALSRSQASLGDPRA